ncbi:MAG TPA: bacteriohopanetetrol glucosamine biosynthesis glycosyltransferase HpnI [Dongiaceae bacterium]|nr:bacteriohopanetetrol glucosamine biosynthesis glycosyltransferase HpnI [Dongiaceae bacterium]
MIDLLAIPALLSLALTLWQSLVARRFPLHQRQENPRFHPALTLLKPLKGCDAETERCLRSWLTQEYPGPVQILFGVARAEDPVCDLVRRLLAEFPGCEAQLVICTESLGTNAKVSTLIQLEQRARHDFIVVSDADVCVPADFLNQIIRALEEPAVGLVNCFYQLANPNTLALRWEAVAMNADFWSQVLQSRSLSPLKFALGAVMATRRKELAGIGGFTALVDCLADDYQLGHRIAKNGGRIELSPVVVECWSAPLSWRQVWQHQLRWARTIRVCQPLPYFFSILSNATLWPLVWLLAGLATGLTGAALQDRLTAVLFCLLVRVGTAFILQWRLTRKLPGLASLGLTLVKDLLQVLIWFLAFAGNHIEWRGEHYRLQSDGTLKKIIRSGV